VPDRSKLAQSDDLAFALARAHKHVNNRLLDTLKSRKLPVEQWRILSMLSDGEGHAVGSMCDQVLMSFSALSKTIDRMVSRALVHRKQDENDNRRVLVFITDFGIELFDECKQDMKKCEPDFDGGLNNDEKLELKNLLERLSRH